MSPSIVCWNCTGSVTLDEREDQDGYCPHCLSELDLSDYLVQAITERDALRLDAERYRWLRAAENDVAVMFGGHAWEDMSDKWLDAAIDQAMRGDV